MLKGEHSAILLNFIKLPICSKTFVLSSLGFTLSEERRLRPDCSYVRARLSICCSPMRKLPNAGLITNYYNFLFGYLTVINYTQSDKKYNFRFKLYIIHLGT